MDIKKISISTLIIAVTIIILITYFKFFKSNDIEKIKSDSIEENSFSSNIIKEVNYISKDAKGNEYIINAKTGEIDINNSDIIFLTDVNALINLKNSEKINIILKIMIQFFQKM